MKLLQLFELRERAGDTAYGDHLYSDAARRYQEALDVPVPVSLARDRLPEKLCRALFLSGDYRAADRAFKRLLVTTPSNGNDLPRQIEFLFQMYNQLMWECERDAGMQTLVRAVRIAEASGDERLTKLTQLRRVEALELLSRFDDASKALNDVGHVGAGDDSVLRGHYLVAHAMAAVAEGNAETAYANFEAAVELAKADSDPYRVIVLWTRYAYRARELGDLPRAKACCEQALLVARQYRITWMIAHTCLHYARLLACMGQPLAAYPYLLQSVSAIQPVPLLDIVLAIIGMPIALQLNDQEMLKQCANPKTIKYAFQSGKADSIGAIACVFARLYISEGRPAAARELLHKALGKIVYAHFNIEVLLAIAQHGMASDLPRARAILIARVALPHATLFQAGLVLFDAFAQQRAGAAREARRLARRAAELFEKLQWLEYVELARSMLPDGEMRPRRRPDDNVSFIEKSTLTVRERQVAGLVLRGLTNPEIAAELNIALNTVEKHMNSIMNRLGVRSRYQVSDALQSSPE